MKGERGFAIGIVVIIAIIAVLMFTYSPKDRESQEEIISEEASMFIAAPIPDSVLGLQYQQKDILLKN